MRNPGKVSGRVELGGPKAMATLGSTGWGVEAVVVGYTHCPFCPSITRAPLVSRPEIYTLMLLLFHLLTMLIGNWPVAATRTAVESVWLYEVVFVSKRFVVEWLNAMALLCVVLCHVVAFKVFSFLTQMSCL